MILEVHYCDLFQYGEELERRYPNQIYYMHCISADLAMGAGIAVPFNEKFKIREQFEEAFKEGVITPDDIEVRSCIRTGQVLNLITKQKYWMKPSYSDMTDSLFNARQIVNHLLQTGRAVDPEYDVHIVLPTIGCGLDKLKWDKVQRIIMDTFMGYSSVRFHVCKKEK